MAKAMTLLGFAKKAGKLNAGTESCIRAIITGKAKLVIISNDAGDSIKTKVIRLASENDIKEIRIKLYLQSKMKILHRK